MKKILMGNVVVVTFVIVLVISFTGCSFAGKEILQGSNPAISEPAQSGAEGKNKTEITGVATIEQDKQLTEKLLGENEVMLGQVYLQGDTVKGCIVVKEGIKDETAKELAQRYADELKEKYNGKKVSVQAVKRNKNVAIITE